MHASPECRAPRCLALDFKPGAQGAGRFGWSSVTAEPLIYLDGPIIPMEKEPLAHVFAWSLDLHRP
jgi:hypothetical protein